MNLVLIDPEELAPDQRVVLDGRRAEHLHKVLKVRPGDRVRIGVLGGASGHGEVLAWDGPRVTLQCELTQAPPRAPRDTLLLGFARPKVLLRCFEHAAALGFGRVIVFRSRRVERSHLASHAVEPAVYVERLRRGLEQARRTLLPSVHFVPRFRELIERCVPELVPGSNRFVADADAPLAAVDAEASPGPLSLVIGPEGGLVDHELSNFSEHGFRIVHTGREPLRVESALSYVTGQLRAVRALKSPAR